MRVTEGSLGVKWNLRDRLMLSLEGFYKFYDRVPLSVADGVPLTCKGNDYGVVGNLFEVLPVLTEEIKKARA